MWKWFSDWQTRRVREAETASLRQAVERADKLVSAYCNRLQQMTEALAPESSLPAKKHAIKAALKLEAMLNSANSQYVHLAKANFLALSSFVEDSALLGADLQLKEPEPDNLVPDAMKKYLAAMESSIRQMQELEAEWSDFEKRGYLI